MSLQDLVSDFISRVNNSKLIEKSPVEVIKSNFILELCKKLTKLGFFTSFEQKNNTILVYPNFKKLVKLRRVSKPGRRVYASYKDSFKIFGGFGYIILSTSKGIITNIEAKQEKAGGEAVLEVVSAFEKPKTKKQDKIKIPA